MVAILIANVRLMQPYVAYVSTRFFRVPALSQVTPLALILA
jgi:hypothetical protein